MKSRLTCFALMLRNQMIESHKTCNGLFDLLEDMYSDKELNYIAKNKETINYINSIAGDGAKYQLHTLVELYKKRREPIILPSR